MIPCVPPKKMIYGIVLVKNVKMIFTLKQINFSFPDQTAVKWPFQTAVCINLLFHVIQLSGSSRTTTDELWQKKNWVSYILDLADKDRGLIISIKENQTCSSRVAVKSRSSRLNVSLSSSVDLPIY